jgi:heat shock protein HslJ
MKYRLLLLPLALTACSQTPPPTAAEPSPSASTAPASEAATHGTTATIDTSLLGQYHWQLASATDSTGKRIDTLFVRPDKPLELNFSAGQLNISNSCNGMGGGYKIENGQLQIGPMMQTMMACPDPNLSALDAAISQRLQGRLKLNLKNDGATPLLQLITPNGDTLNFSSQPTADTRYGGPGETVFLEVAAQTVPCNHPLIPNKQCLQIRERHYNDHGLQTSAPGEWQPLNQDIEGYTHEDGIRNVLRVKRYAIKNPPADAPSTAYVLDMVVETEKVK